MNASIDVAIQLEDLFDRQFSDPVDVMEGADEVREAEPTPQDPALDPDGDHVLAVLARVGFTVHPTTRAPFTAVSEDGEREIANLLTGHSAFTRSAEKRARIMSSLGEVTRTRSVYVTEEREKRDAVEGTALVSQDELAELRDADDLRDLILERARSPAES
jgi:putative transcriptional regulator